LARHFLGSVSKDAVGNETSIKVGMGGEKFTCNGLIVEQYNYLEVYTFDKWTNKYVPKFIEGE
jgi:DNA topoisomerase-3